MEKCVLRHCEIEVERNRNRTQRTCLRAALPEERAVVQRGHCLSSSNERILRALYLYKLLIHCFSFMGHLSPP